jgi:hypothetical protein
MAQIPFLGDVYEIICFSWTHTEDFLKAFLLSIASVYSYFKSMLSRNTYVSQNYVYESLSRNLRPVASISDTVKLANDEIKNHAPIEMMHKLAHASKSVQNVDISSTIRIDELISSYNLNSLNINDCIDQYSFKSTKTLNLLSIADIEQSYTAMSKDMSFIQQFDTESANLNKVSSYNVALATTNFNTQDALRSAKQDR